MQITIDQGTATNSITITVQYSNDNTNWDDGAALLSSSIVDVTEMTRVPVFGRYMRFAEDIADADSDAVTVTIKALYK